MGSKIDIPLVYDVTKPDALKRDLQRFAQSVDQYTRNAPSTFSLVPNPSPSTTLLAFDMTTRVSLKSGDNVTLQLPQPDPKNGRRTLYIRRETILGNCYIRGVGCTINGRPSKLLPAAPGMYEITFDGTNYYSNPQLAADWGG